MIMVIGCVKDHGFLAGGADLNRCTRKRGPKPQQKTQRGGQKSRFLVPVTRASRRLSIHLFNNISSSIKGTIHQKHLVL